MYKCIHIYIYICSGRRDDVVSYEYICIFIYTYINVHICICIHIFQRIGRRDDGVSSDRCKMEEWVIVCRLADHSHF